MKPRTRSQSRTKKVTERHASLHWPGSPLAERIAAVEQLRRRYYGTPLGAQRNAPEAQRRAG